MKKIASVKQHSSLYKEQHKVIKTSPEKRNSNIKIAFSQDNISSASIFEETHNSNPLLTDDYARATDCISRIADPLWKNICVDILHMMGPVSVLKIWKSTLGEFIRQDKSFDIVCETEETLQFVQQYDFVILGSLQRYLPFLKQLKVSPISNL